MMLSSAAWALLYLLATTEMDARPLIGDAAPGLPLVGLDGESIPPDASRGETTVVEFFATWCAPCRRSLEDILQVHATLERERAATGSPDGPDRPDAPAPNRGRAGRSAPGGTGASDGPGVRAFRLLLVDEGEPALLVRRHLAALSLPPGTRVALDPDGAAGRRWGRDRLPTTFVLDAGGVIRHINRGHGAGFRARLERWLRSR